MTRTGRNYVIGIVVASASLLGVTACGPATGSQDGVSVNRWCSGPGCTGEGVLDPDGNGRFDPSPLSPDRVRQYG